MDIVKRNPYRVLGLLGNSSERELQKQVGAIKRFAEVGKVKEFDTDLSFMGSVPRSTADIQEASSKLEQSHNKLLYSLFWFIKCNPFDEIALNNLKDENFSKAFDIWKKTLKDKVSDKNYSSYHNLSTLYLFLSVTNKRIDLAYLKKCVDLKKSLIQSSSMGVFSELVACDRLVINEVGISKSFADEIIQIAAPFISNNAGLTTKDLISLFADYPSDVQKHISNKYTAEPISKIEKLILDTAANRKADPSDAEKYGEKLYNDTKRNISQLESVLGRDSAQFQSVVNKLALEILQCSIDFFNMFIHEKETFDPIKDALRLTGYANALGATGRAEMRIQEALKTMEGWNESALLDQSIKESDDFLAAQLSEFIKLPANIGAAERFVNTCEDKLEDIKSKLGCNDEYYIELCDLIVNQALNAVIVTLNNKQKNLPGSGLAEFREALDHALSVLELLSVLDMTQEARNRLETNQQAFAESRNQLLNAAISQALPTKSNGWCYIATMAYGDYDHPKVMILREYRDEVLASTSFGRCFIKIYYATSPYMVKLLKDQKQINNLIRHGLDKLIGYIK
ncbi:MAG: hypothetical protein P1U35_12420 [Cycloclasticus sp.]|nr:hypothetical protein [Cycloclasticus sp.]